MAYFGLSKPYIAKLGATEGTYTLGFKCGKAVAIEINPTSSEGKLYGDNVLAEYASEFKEAAVTLDVTTLPLEAANVLFGHTVATETKLVTKNAGDVSNYVGFGFIVKEMIEGVVSYTATVVYKAKFSEQGLSYTTKGDSIEFKTPKLTGIASAPDSGNWQKVQTFETEALAEAFVKTELDIVA